MRFVAVGVIVGALASVGGAGPERSVARDGVCLVPLGPHDAALLDDARAGIEYLYGVPVTVVEGRPLPKAAWYAPRKRWRADALLDFLDADVVPEVDCAIVVGFTKRDISTTKGEHADWGILGLARIGGPSAVVSTFRMRKGASRRRVRERAIKVTNHELGHALGVPHQTGEGCLMNDAGGTVKHVDTETGLLCEPARAIIERRTGLRVPDRDAFDWSAVLDR